MKTTMKKWGILAAALLLATALIIGCPAVKGPPTGNNDVPEGMGLVKLNISLENSARATILPGTATIGSFGDFVLDFTADPTGSGVDKQQINLQADMNDPVTLIPGDYSLLVTGRLTAGAAATAAAVFDSEDGVAGTYTVPVTVGGTNTLNIVLRPYDPDGTGTGTFTWTINSTINGTVISDSGTGGTDSELQVVTLAGAAPASGWAADIDLSALTTTAPVTGTATIPTGYYYVTIVLNVDGTVRTFRHVLHIYRGMTSNFTYTFTDDHIGIESVIFTPNITYDPLVDYSPVLALGAVTPAGSATLTGDGSFADPHILTIEQGSTAVINVSNWAAVYTIPTTPPPDVDVPYTNVAWYISPNFATAVLDGDPDPGADDTGTYTVSAVAAAPFNTLGSLQLLVVGTVNVEPFGDQEFSTEIIVKTVAP